jgi:hypothetical protein
VSTYKVRVYIPTYYEIEAESEEEAKETAEYLFKKENSEWVGNTDEIIEFVVEVKPL